MNNNLDALTQVYCRDAFFARMDKLIAKGKKFALMVLDVDNFKYVNDYNGHLTGDKVLQSVAERMKTELDEYGIVGRYGGDEFLALLEDKEDYDDIWHICHNMMNAINRPFKKDGSDLSVSATIGLARFPKDADNAIDLFELADKALFRGKTKGRNCFIIYLAEKHKNLDLMGESKKRFSSTYIHSHVFTLLTHGESLSNRIASALNFLSDYFMIDHICLATEEKLLFEIYHPLVKKRECAPIDLKYIYENLNPATGLYHENNVENLLDKNQLDLYEDLRRQSIRSTVYIKIEVFGITYGFLRADVVSLVRGRIWQPHELDVMIGLAQNLALIMNSLNLSFKDLAQSEQ